MEIQLQMKNLLKNIKIIHKKLKKMKTIIDN